MADITGELLDRLSAYRLPELHLAGDFIYPNYEGQSILNIPSTICRWLGVPEIGARALIPEISAAFGEDTRRVIFILMDALGLELLRGWLADDRANGRLAIWKRLIQEGLFAPLTSITPSTTTAALTTLWTGQSPAVHAVVGYELWLKEYGMVTNMILQSPMSFAPGGFTQGSLAQAGFDPETSLRLPTLGQHLAAHGVRTYAFQPQAIARSGLSRTFFKDVFITPFGTAADLWISARQLYENHPDEKLYTWVYWGEVDHYSHFHGPTDERLLAEFEHFSAAFETLFVNRLSKAARKDTLVVLAADHGQVFTQLNPHYDLRNHPNLVRRLHIYPTGENRLAYLYIRPGQLEAVREYVDRTWPRQFVQLDPLYAASAGLFGPGEPHPRLLDRLGDLILAARGSAYLWWADKDNPLLGRHGGLGPEEMLVPFIASRL